MVRNESKDGESRLGEAWTSSVQDPHLKTDSDFCVTKMKYYNVEFTTVCCIFNFGHCLNLFLNNDVTLHNHNQTALQTTSKKRNTLSDCFMPDGGGGGNISAGEVIFLCRLDNANKMWRLCLLREQKLLAAWLSATPLNHNCWMCFKYSATFLIFHILVNRHQCVGDASGNQLPDVQMQPDVL